MQQSKRLFSIALILVFLTGAAFAQELMKQGEKQTVAPSAGSNPVVGSVTPQAFPPLVNGSGTVGKIPKWTAFNSLFSTLGDSLIAESNGKIGIGTSTPTSLLTVQGMIETTLGGYKFPDGTIQTTVGIANVLHDATLQGNGTEASPLGVAVPLNLSDSLGEAVISATNSSGPGLQAQGGNDINNTGVIALGGNGSISNSGGFGVLALGGGNISQPGGTALIAFGGAGSVGGHGIVARPGDTFGATPGFAGIFEGNVDVFGKLTKAMGTFKIDHPLDPENKYLYHSFVESPDMMNIYNGNITTDSNGEAIVTMPHYFDALNKDFRYQLTVIGQFAQAIVASEMKDNRFVIKTNAPRVKVSWHVTGVRHDAYAEKNRVQVEEDKVGA